MCVSARREKGGRISGCEDGIPRCKESRAQESARIPLGGETEKKDASRDKEREKIRSAEKMSKEHPELVRCERRLGPGTPSERGGRGRFVRKGRKTKASSADCRKPALGKRQIQKRVGC